MAKSEIDKLTDKLKKTYKDTFSNPNEVGIIKRLVMDSPNMNFIFGGGFPIGKPITVFGGECLDGDTFIKFEVRDKKTGKSINYKGGTIRRLYERFHKVDVTGIKQGRHLMKTDNIEFLIASINEEGRIIKNQIVDVFESGEKQVYEVIDSYGHKIIATMNHKFYTPTGYKPLQDIQVDNIVYVHTTTPFKKDHIRKNYKETCVKYHSRGKKKLVSANNKQGKKVYFYIRHRVRNNHLVFEAFKNSMSVENYIEFLNTRTKKEIDSLWTVPKTHDVHHIDENPENNSLYNLQLLFKSEHYKLHACKNHNNLRFTVVESKIVSIKKLKIVPTYDISCKAPYNNFIANNFVVHNSAGKTVIAYYVASQFQKRNDDPKKRTVVFVDMEHSFNTKYAQAVGLDPDNNFILLRPVDGEEGFTVLEELIRTGEIGFVIWDSVAATPSRRAIEAEFGKASFGGTAALMSQALVKINPLFSRYETSCIFVNQVRANLSTFKGFGPGSDENSNSGGWALKFYSAWRGRVSKGEDIVLNKEVIGNQIKIRNVKSKIGIPKRSIQLDLYYDRGLDTEQEYIGFIIDLEIVHKSGAWLKNEEWKMNVQGRDGLLAWFKDHPDKWVEAKEKVDASFSGSTVLDRIDIDVPDVNLPDEVDDEDDYSDEEK